MPNVKMPTPEEGSSIEELSDIMRRYKKQLEYLLQNLDSMNVRSITTEYTKVKSEYGETEIDGPQIKMNDKTNDRLLAGYDDVSLDFVFKLFDVNGDQTISLNSEGKAIINGEIDVLQDGDGLTQIIGPLINMYDDLATLRLQLGQDQSIDKFIFRMWDVNGDQTIDVNDAGEAVFKGNIETLKDAYVGDNLYIGDTEEGFPSIKKISFFESTNGTEEAEIVVERTTDLYPSMDFKAASMFFSAWDSITFGRTPIVSGEGTLATRDWVTDNFATQSDINDAISNHVAAYHSA